MQEVIVGQSYRLQPFGVGSLLAWQGARLRINVELSDRQYRSPRVKESIERGPVRLKASFVAPAIYLQLVTSHLGRVSLMFSRHCIHAHEPTAEGLQADVVYAGRDIDLKPPHANRGYKVRAYRRLTLTAEFVGYLANALEAQRLLGPPAFYAHLVDRPRGEVAWAICSRTEGEGSRPGQPGLGEGPG